MIYEARGRQEGMTVFQVSGRDVDFVMNELRRYAHQYREEGDIVLEQKLKGRWKRLIALDRIV